MVSKQYRKKRRGRAAFRSKNKKKSQKKPFKNQLMVLAKFFVITFLFTVLIFLLTTIRHELLSSNIFQVRQVTFSGLNNAAGEEELLNEIRMNLLTNNIFLLDLKTISNTLKQSKWIRDVEVKRKLPDTVHINVKEYIPIAVINLDGFYYIDKQGMIFKTVEDFDIVNLPIITGLEDRSYETKNSMPSYLLQKTIQLIDTIPEDIMDLSKISEINVNNEMGISIYSDEKNIKIIMGFDKFDRKWRRFSSIMDYSLDENLSFEQIDLDFEKIAVAKIHPNL